MRLKDQHWLRVRGKDIAWLMPDVDVKDVLARMGSRIESHVGHEIRAFCPDHHLYTGKEPSHANCTVNVKTGETFCFTEGRGSNLIYIAARLLDCGVKEAIAFLVNKPGELDLGGFEISALKARAAKMRAELEVERPAVKGLDVIAGDMVNPYLSEDAYRFFMHPPGKKYSTDILPDTVHYFQVFERTWGYYSGRVVIPFVMRGLVVGFCAVDIRGKDEWLRVHPLKDEDDYRKVLYPSNMVSGNCLFGFDECEKGAEFVVVVEGPREKMKLWQEGFPNSVAILGSYMSDEQMKLLGELGPKRVVLMFDGDDAGLAATDRIAKKLERSFPGDKMQKCFPQRGKDPKNLGREELERLVYR